MATVSINLCTSTSRLQQQPVANDVVVNGVAITSSGASQATSFAATTDASQDEYWCVTSKGGAVWVTFAAAPVAVAGTTWLVPDGGTLWLRATPGYKCAIIDAL